jgi:hypothetical protein
MMPPSKKSFFAAEGRAKNLSVSAVSAIQFGWSSPYNARWKQGQLGLHFYSSGSRCLMAQRWIIHVAFLAAC